MTTTAYDDQFTAATERHIAQPYDVAAILRQNVADLEFELKRQKERHAAATARLRDQIERVTSEWERAEAELKAARINEDCLKCSNRGKTNGLSQESFCDSCIYQGKSWRVNHFSGFSAAQQSPAVKYMGRRMSPDGTRECWGFDIGDELPEGTLLYAAPIPAAPAVPDEWKGWKDVAVHGYPEKPMECMFVIGGRVVHGAYLAGAFWYSNERVAIAMWMPMPEPLSPDKHRAMLQSAIPGDKK